MDNTTTLEIVCPNVEDMAGEWDKNEIEEEIREILERDPKTGHEWIEWVMNHDDIGDFFTQQIIDIVCMPEFRKGTFILDGEEFTIIKS